jgi:translation initiation factor 4A
VSNVHHAKTLAQLHWQELQRIEQLQAIDLNEPIESFDDLLDEFNLNEQLLRGVYSCGFEKPTEVQKRAIRPMLCERHLVLQAPSRSGASTALIIGAMGIGMSASPGCQVIIIAPTRDTAAQLYRQVLAIVAHMGVTCYQLVGGGRVRDDIDACRFTRPQVVIGTPARLFDMILKRHLQIDSLRMVVLDGIDDIVSRGFKEQVCDIFRYLTPDIQVCVYSPSFSIEASEMTTKFTRDPVRILIEDEAKLTLEGVRQYYVAIEKEEWKLDTFCDLVECVDIPKYIVYCNSRRKVVYLAYHLRNHEYFINSELRVFSMHSDSDERECDRIMQDFMSVQPPHRCVLISQDPRYFDQGRWQGTSTAVIVNFDLPMALENYLPRVGRLVRWGSGSCYGSSVVAISFVTNNDVRSMKDIEKYYQTQIEEMPMDIADQL